MNAASDTTRAQLIPFALKDAPALIESVFPAQKISFEAQRERKAGAGQTLTALGSYWKGRKPLVLVRAIVLGSLLPQTGDPDSDLDMLEKLMALDEEGLARRAYRNNGLKASELAASIELVDPWRYFSHSVDENDVRYSDVERMTFPLDCRRQGFLIRWRSDVQEEVRISLIRQAISTFKTYEAKAALCKRSEEIEDEWLYEAVWPAVNRHLSQLGVEAFSHQELVEQLGILRYGHRPRVGDTFCGGGSIPFEAARLGCDVYGADLNPVACMLTWASLNVLAAGEERRQHIEAAQLVAATGLDDEITALGVEYDEHGNRAKAYLYCLETRCPESGWMVPMASSWVVSKTRNVIAKLVPDHGRKRFDIDIVTSVSDEEVRSAERGTVRNGDLVYEIDRKNYRIPIRTIRGDYRDADGTSRSRLRQWEAADFKPRPEDIFQERLYAIHWIKKDSLHKKRQEAFFASVREADLERERQVEGIVGSNFARWQRDGLIPDMGIEAGYNTDQPTRERGWKYWHQLFSPRDLLGLATYHRHVRSQPSEVRAALVSTIPMIADNACKLCGWNPGHPGSGEFTTNVFNNQALNTHYNYSCRSVTHVVEKLLGRTKATARAFGANSTVSTSDARSAAAPCDLFVTDPPYADAVNYHEITEFFIAWLRRYPPPPFDQWTWDSRRSLAIKGMGDEFRRGMVDAYQTMREQMPDHGMQCVMFTHQDTGVWADMVGIFWAAGLQVVAAWYIATETTSELKKGGYVQGTVILMLKKRSPGERAGFKQRILPQVRAEVERQIQSMMHLNSEVRRKHGEPVFNDSDLQMGGYAAALKVLTAFTHIGGEDVTTFALRPRQKGEVTVVDEIVQQAAEAANSLLVPEDLSSETWSKLSGIQRFYLRMMDMETTGTSKLDNYQNFAKAFRVQDYVRVMGNITANKARLKRITEFASRNLTESTEIGGTVLGNLIIGVQQLLKEVEPRTVISQLQAEMPDFIEMRPLIIDMLSFIERKSPDPNVRSAAEVFGARLRNLRAIGQ
jgi:putative DNA methylase